MEHHLFILFVALVADWLVGDPDWLWRKVPHPAALFGKIVGLLDKQLNQETQTGPMRERAGALALVLLLAIGLSGGAILAGILHRVGPLGWLAEIAVVTVLLAQKSLADHVRAVVDGLRDGGLAGGRKAVSMIVGRDPEQLDRSGVSRAAIESLAENFSDGVVAPAFWYALLGLPGIIAYKMLNTADSMIGHRSEKYLHFGRWSAKADDIANFVPARISAALAAAGVWSLLGVARARAAFGGALRDAGLHRSPNAGWPEAAFAHGLGIALGGVRIYAGESVQQAWLNASGRTSLDIADIESALALFARATFALWISVAALWLLAW